MSPEEQAQEIARSYAGEVDPYEGLWDEVTRLRLTKTRQRPNWGYFEQVLWYLCWIPALAWGAIFVIPTLLLLPIGVGVIPWFIMSLPFYGLIRWRHARKSC